MMKCLCNTHAELDAPRVPYCPVHREIGAMEEQSTKRRFTTVHDRFQITDACCGIIETAMSLKDAEAIAARHARKHKSEPDNTITHVSIFDSMARNNQPHEWQVSL